MRNKDLWVGTGLPVCLTQMEHLLQSFADPGTTVPTTPCCCLLPLAGSPHLIREHRGLGNACSVSRSPAPWASVGSIWPGPLPPLPICDSPCHHPLGCDVTEGGNKIPAIGQDLRLIAPTGNALLWGGGAVGKIRG
jgi:hypothetical protein